MPFEQPQNQKEAEFSPEKKNRVWEILRTAGLAGLLTFGAFQGGKTALESMTIVDGSHEGVTMVDGKRVMKGEVQTADGKKYKIKTSADVLEKDIGKVGPAGLGSIDFNTSYMYAQNKDGSGVAIKVDVYPWGAKLTTQELGPGGEVLNEKVSSIKEELKNVMEQANPEYSTNK